MSITSLITPARVTLSLSARDAGEAMDELCRLLTADGSVVDPPAYLTAVRHREAIGSTAVGFHVAIPHGKSAGVARAAVAFGRSANGIDWPAADGEPVHLVFLIAAPEGAHDEHLKALAQLARMLVHEEVRQRLLAADTPEEVLTALS